MYRSRFLIADDHKLVAELCQNLLEPEFDVVGVVNDGRALLRAASALARQETLASDTAEFLPIRGLFFAVRHVVMLHSGPARVT
jgi:CheY-like chemotaxis protein